MWHVYSILMHYFVTLQSSILTALLISVSFDSFATSFPNAAKNYIDGGNKIGSHFNKTIFIQKIFTVLKNEPVYCY